MRSKNFGGRAVPAFPTDKWWSLTKKYNSRIVFRPSGPFPPFKRASLGRRKRPPFTFRTVSKPDHYGQKKGRSIFKLGK